MTGPSCTDMALVAPLQRNINFSSTLLHWFPSVTYEQVLKCLLVAYPF